MLSVADQTEIHCLPLQFLPSIFFLNPRRYDQCQCSWVYQCSYVLRATCPSLPRSESLWTATWDVKTKTVLCQVCEQVKQVEG